MIWVYWILQAYMILTFCYTFIIINQTVDSQPIFQINCLHTVIAYSYISHNKIKRTVKQSLHSYTTVLT